MKRITDDMFDDVQHVAPGNSGSVHDNHCIGLLTCVVYVVL